MVSLWWTMIFMCWDVWCVHKLPKTSEKWTGSWLVGSEYNLYVGINTGKRIAKIVSVFVKD